MSLVKTEKALIDLLDGAMSGEFYLEDDSNLTYAGMIGHGLSYYLTAILKGLKDSNIKDKWIDGVGWRTFNLLPPNKLKGAGKLWWGFNKDSSAETFQEDFYCELEIDNSAPKNALLYLFRFCIDGKNYELKN